MNSIDALVLAIQQKADRTIDENALRNAVHWIHAIMLNRDKIRLDLGGRKQIVNYFGINVADSRSGKSWIMNQLIPLLNIPIPYLQMLQDNFKKAKKDLYKYSIAEPRFLSTIVEAKRESTTQGIHKIAEATQVAAHIGGSLNIKVDEMFLTMNMTIMENLLEGFDGKFPMPNIKGKDDFEYEDVTNVPVNFFGMSSPSPLYGDKTRKDDFMTLLETGWFRRAFVINSSGVKVRAKMPENVKLPDVVKERLVTPMNKDFVLSKEAYELYSDLNKFYLEDESEYSSMKDIYVMLNLACIRAYSNFRNEVTREDIEYAYEFQEKCFEDAKNIMKMSHEFIRIYFQLLNKEMSENELVRMKLLPSNNKLRDGVIADLDDYAMEHNSQLYRKRTQSGTYKFYVRKFAETDGYFKLSYADWNGEKGGFTPNYDKVFEGNIEDLAQLIKSGSIQMTQFLLKNRITTGKTNRTKDNLISVGTLFFDFDDGDVKIEDVINIFGRYQFLARKSSSFTKEKQKFHLVLPLKYQINMTHDDFRTMYLGIATKFGLIEHIDISMAKSVQPMYELANVDDYLHMKNEEGDEYELFDPRCCMEGSTQDLTTKRIYGKINPKNRVIRYIDKMLPDLYEGKREPSTNAFIWSMMNSEPKPSHGDMMEALNVIIAHIADPKWESKNRKKFEKMINDNF